MQKDFFMIFLFIGSPNYFAGPCSPFRLLSWMLYPIQYTMYVILQVMCIFLYSALRERAVVEGIKPTTEKTHRGNPIKRAKWHLGIRSQSKPQDIMNEVYRAMKTLNFVSLGNCRKKNWHFSSTKLFFFNSIFFSSS